MFITRTAKIKTALSVEPNAPHSRPRHGYIHAPSPAQRNVWETLSRRRNGERHREIPASSQIRSREGTFRPLSFPFQIWKGARDQTIHGLHESYHDQARRPSRGLGVDVAPHRQRLRGKPLSNPSYNPFFSASNSAMRRSICAKTFFLEGLSDTRAAIAADAAASFRSRSSSLLGRPPFPFSSTGAITVGVPTCSIRPREVKAAYADGFLSIGTVGGGAIGGAVKRTLNLFISSRDVDI